MCLSIRTGNQVSTCSTGATWLASSLDESLINTDCNISVDDSVADENSCEYKGATCGHNENLPSTCTSILTSQPTHSNNTRGVPTNEGSGSFNTDSQDCFLPQLASSTAKPQSLLPPTTIQQSSEAIGTNQSPYNVRNSVFYFAQPSSKQLSGACHKEEECAKIKSERKCKSKKKKGEPRSPVSRLVPRSPVSRLVLHSPMGSLIPTSPLLYQAADIKLFVKPKSPSHKPVEETDV